MIYDILTITQKDLKEFFVQRGSMRSGITNILIIVAITGLLFPLQFGREWITNPIGLVSVTWLPLFMSMGMIADAFAGERERHTLETLLASRLSDQSILYGKILAAVTYGMGIALAGMLVGAVTVNVAYPGVGFYPIENFLGMIVLSFLGSLLISSLGVLVSMRAGNVRQAYQRMSLGFMVLWLPIILVPQFISGEAKAQMNQWIMNINGVQVAAGFAGLLLLLDIVLLTLDKARFQRSRLILEE
jgi:ABC-2 type transport system permease protein